MFTEEINQFLLEYGLPEGLSNFLTTLLMSVIVVITVITINFLTRKIILSFFKRIAKSTVSHFDDLLIKNKVPSLLSYIPSIFFLFWILSPYSNIFTIALESSLAILIILTIRSVLGTVKDFFKSSSKLKHIPIDSYVQVIMIILWFIGIILVLSILTGREIGTFLAAIGAFSAIIILVFRDTILGFVSSIQVSVNDTVRIGDWITMESAGADGNVIEINLSTVIVKNFDNSISTIPTYKLVSDSFKNWRAMEESGGRRIKRSLLIRSTSVRFLNSDEVSELKKINLISDYLTDKSSEINDYNSKLNVESNDLINGRNLTNLGIFRIYVEKYLLSHPLTNDDLTLMCRQLEPTSQGIPIQIYTFTKDKEWTKYESIASDIFDHLLSSIKYFHLESFELNQYNSN
ncbi:MAG: mechanosensitive ion channel domain-containing protein [Bacteroidota bacterium]